MSKIVETTGHTDDDIVHGREDAFSGSVSEKEAERRRLEEEVAAYLARGGTIRQIPANVLADPPKKPQSNYGGQPI